MTSLSTIKQAIEYVYTYFSWGYYYFSAGYFCYDKFNTCDNLMRDNQGRFLLASPRYAYALA